MTEDTVLPMCDSLFHQGASEADPAWLVHREQELYLDYEGKIDPSRALLDILRPMLQAPGDAATAPNEAAKQIASHYVGPYLASLYQPDQEPTKSTLMPFLNEVTRLVFELVTRVTFPSLEHDRLSHVLIELYKLWPAVFGVEERDPGFESYHHGIGSEVAERRNDNQVPNHERDGFETDCKVALLTATLLAKLFQAGALGDLGGDYASWQINDGILLEQRPGRTPYPLSTLPFAQDIATWWIAIAGKALAAEVRDPSRKRKKPFTTESWKECAVAFSRLAARTDGELKEHAEQAHARMVSLFPALFEQEV